MLIQNSRLSLSVSAEKQSNLDEKLHAASDKLFSCLIRPQAYFWMNTHNILPFYKMN